MHSRPEPRGHRCRGDAVLSRAGFRDHALLAHAHREQSLPERIIDFVRAGVQQIFALQINRAAARLFGQSRSKLQRRRAPGKIAQQCIEFGVKSWIGLRRGVGALEFFQRRHQRLRHVAAAERAVAPALRRAVASFSGLALILGLLALAFERAGFLLPLASISFATSQSAQNPSSSLCLFFRAALPRRCKHQPRRAALTAIASATFSGVQAAGEKKRRLQSARRANFANRTSCPCRHTASRQIHPAESRRPSQTFSNCEARKWTPHANRLNHREHHAQPRRHDCRRFIAVQLRFVQA